MEELHDDIKPVFPKKEFNYWQAMQEKEYYKRRPGIPLRVEPETVPEEAVKMTAEPELLTAPEPEIIPEITEATEPEAAPEPESIPEITEATEPEAAPEPEIIPEITEATEPEAAPEPEIIPEITEATEPETAPEPEIIPEITEATEPEAAPEPEIIPVETEKKEPETVDEPESIHEEAEDATMPVPELQPYVSSASSDEDQRSAFARISFCVIGVIIAVPIYCVVCGVSIAIAAAIVGISIGFTAASIVLCVTGISGIIYGVIQLFGVTQVGLASLGSGLILVALGIIFGLISIKLCSRVLTRFVKWIVTKCRHPFGKPKTEQDEKEVKQSV